MADMIRIVTFLYVLIGASLITFVNSSGNLRELKAFIPNGCDRDEYIGFGGICNHTMREQLLENFQAINHLLNQTQVTSEEDGMPFLNLTSSFGGDFLISLKQSEDLRDIFEELQEEKKRKRRRRRHSKLIKNFVVNRWTMPIKYRIDGYLAVYAESHIRKAVAEWQDKTCVRFEEVDVDEELNEHHLVFLPTLSAVCYSYIGKTDLNEEDQSQPIFLSTLCMNKGILTHEIGHTLGLIHEHQRPDRDNYIQIVNSNVQTNAERLFTTIPTKFIDTARVPYDYGSNMHYMSEAFSANGNQTIKTVDRRFQKTIGQRVELSFWDIFAINQAYCSDTCKGIHIGQCANNGYQDPNNCSQCLCPDGWSGRYCTDLANATGEPCGGRWRVQDGEKIFVQSPNYMSRGVVDYYHNGQECTWLIEGSGDKPLVMRFEGDLFSVFCYERCLHWVEIRSGENLGSSGPRYCCYDKPNDIVVSNTGRILVIFKTKDDFAVNEQRLGFKLSFATDGDECSSNPCQHGGACADGLAEYTCTCRWPYTGKHCEEYVNNHCASGPCQNNGVCINQPYSYRCRCPWPFSGSRCQIRMTTPTTTTTTTTTTSPTTTTTIPTTTTTTSTTITTPTTTSPTTPTTTTATTASRSKTQDDEMDLIFLMDVSNPGNKNLTCFKQFILSLTDHFNFGLAATRIGLITFAQNAYTTTTLDDHIYKQGLVDDIDNQKIRGTEATANYYNALLLLELESFLSRKGGRAEAPDVAVFLTDNRPSDSHLRVYRNVKKYAIERLTENNIKMYTIGLGANIDSTELVDIVGQRQYYNSPTCDDLLSTENIQRTFSMVKALANEIRHPNQNSHALQSEDTTSSTVSNTQSHSSSSATVNTPTTASTTSQSRTESAPKTTSLLTHILSSSTTTASTTESTTSQATRSTMPTTQKTVTSSTTTVTSSTTTQYSPDRENLRTHKCWWEQQGGCTKECGAFGTKRMLYMCSSKNSYAPIATLKDVCGMRACERPCPTYFPSDQNTSRTCLYCSHGYSVYDGMCIKSRT